MKSKYRLPVFFPGELGEGRQFGINRRVKDYKYIIDKYVYFNKAYIEVYMTYYSVNRSQLCIYLLTPIEKWKPLPAKDASRLEPYYTEYDIEDFV